MSWLRIDTKLVDAPETVDLTPSDFRTLFIVACYLAQWTPKFKITKRLVCDLPRVTPSAVNRLIEAGLVTETEDGAIGLDGRYFDLGNRPGATRPNGRGWTYLIQAGDLGDIKIGSTRGAPEERLRALQTGSSAPLRLLKVLAGAHLEAQLHRRFARFRTRGEWFSPQILEHLD